MSKPYAFNKRARFDYEILETLEAGIVLEGQEVKSVRANHASLKGAFVVIKDGEAFLLNATISQYQPKNTPSGYDPERSRKLLIKKEDINRLMGKIKEKGLTLVAIKMYNKRGFIKLEIGIGKGKKKFDKRESLKKKDVKREIDRVLRGKSQIRNSKSETISKF
jgi:SsrA-binding protein